MEAKIFSTNSSMGISRSIRRHEVIWPVKPALFRALAILIFKHPVLSAIPVDVDTPNPSFVRLPSIILSEVVTFVDNKSHSRSSDWRKELDNVLEEQHNCLFEDLPKQLRPFWRICVVENNESPHISPSALSFNEELEQYMCQGSGDEYPDVIDTPSTALLPPLESLHTLPVSEEFRLSQEMHHDPSLERWTGAHQSIPVRTRFSSLWISPAETNRLAAVSKAERTSVTATLQTLIATSMFSVLPPSYRELQVDCAMSLRRFLSSPITATSLGCYVGSLSMKYPRMPSFTWSEARRTKTIVEQVVRSKGCDLAVGCLRFIPDQHLWFLQKLGQKRASAIELSNIGKLAPSRGKSDYEIEGMLFSQSASACSAAIKVSAVT
ncbi:hypothetical protein BBP40_012771 [Aspergillus hancockii]|nr:hypothetical protein BBP40_012771 [Aspergillus hancockii]